ncbi:Protein kinase-like domain superfamily [Babesia duncani]|uniref:ethanolamine kinase n=1 Tax=Babesia duncani TaxID=323732 RepID=A0AAD9PLQ1_9APIC|nr:Protein kinase-like domain superfamily [Babesia duncani]
MMDSVLGNCTGVCSASGKTRKDAIIERISTLLHQHQKVLVERQDYVLSTDECIAHCVMLANEQLGIDLEGLDLTVENAAAKLSFLQVQEIKGGLTNMLYKVTNQKNNKSVLLRLFGYKTDNMIDRNCESVICKHLSLYGLSKSIYGYFNGGRIEEWFDGSIPDVKQLESGAFNVIIAQHLGRIHGFPNSVSLYNELHKDANAVVDPSEFKSSLWPTIEIFHKQCVENAEMVQKILGSKLDFCAITAGIPKLRNLCNDIKSPVVICHCDVHLQNVIMVGNEPRLIDFEYANFMERAFDISNHFCEYAGFDCDWSKLPSPQRKREFIRAYLQGLNQGQEPTQDQVEALYQEVLNFTPAPHLYWGLWGLLQTIYSSIDFAFAQYAQKRLEQFLQALE